MNTNADALSRIELNSDEKDSKKLLPITISMKARYNIAEDCNMSQKPHELHIWECTSISDVRHISEKIEFGRINKFKEDFITGIGDNPTCCFRQQIHLITRSGKQQNQYIAKHHSRQP